MRVKLKGVQETLLISLIANADETKSENGKIHDTEAVELVSKIDYDFPEVIILRNAQSWLKSCIHLW